MSKGIYEHKPHSKETIKKMSESHKGLTHSKESRLKMSKVKSNEKNPRWGGDNVTKVAFHR